MVLLLGGCDKPKIIIASNPRPETQIMHPAIKYQTCDCFIIFWVSKKGMHFSRVATHARILLFIFFWGVSQRTLYFPEYGGGSSYFFPRSGRREQQCTSSPRGKMSVLWESEWESGFIIFGSSWGAHVWEVWHMQQVWRKVAPQSTMHPKLWGFDSTLVSLYMTSPTLNQRSRVDNGRLPKRQVVWEERRKGLGTNK